MVNLVFRLRPLGLAVILSAGVQVSVEAGEVRRLLTRTNSRPLLEVDVNNPPGPEVYYACCCSVSS
jgi:hypothetical protein